MRLVDSKKLSELQQYTDNIRNICIVAHVDHGKTTLADSLIASNGIISAKMAGKLRYLDSRPDEQERGITMKSSSIALYFMDTNKKEYLLNLIDSPGHVDFSSEVSTAIRLCDGAIIIVDVVEGVCPQTRIALKQTYSENIKPVLVLNKMDRLILEMKLSPLDAFVHITQVLEQINAVMGELFASEVMEKEDIVKENIQNKGDLSDGTYEWISALDEADDSNIYFSPEQGNVIFGSALDGWGFSIADFARMFSEKFGVKAELLKKVLWGDFYFNAKTKRFMKGAQEKAKKPVFVQIVLDNLWSVYETIVLRHERDKIPGISEKLGIKLTARDLRHTDSKVQLQSLMSQWLPLSSAVLVMICDKLPSPKAISGEKVEKLMSSQIRSYESHCEQTQALKTDFLACDSSEDRPVIVFISKMFPVSRKSLPENKAKPLSLEEMAKRREIIRQKIADRQENTADVAELSTNSANEQQELDDDAFIAFARVFSGTIRKGSRVYVLGPKHDPSQVLSRPNDFKINSELTLKDLKSNEHITLAEVSAIYMLMGRELEELTEAFAGNVVGIGGLDEHVLKTATLSSTYACPSFTELNFAAVPIVRVAVETQHPFDMPKLIKGLKLLNQADACVQVLLQETGEHVLLTAGEVHLERCLDDLRQRYAKVPLTASQPIVPFRETVISPPKLDMVNEEIGVQTASATEKSDLEKLVIMQTPNKRCIIKIRAQPLPADVTSILDNNPEVLKSIEQYRKNLLKLRSAVDKISSLQLNDEETHEKNTQDIKENTLINISERTLKAIESLKSDLQKAFDLAGAEWAGTVNRIWSAGPRKCGPNLLINRTSDCHFSLFNFENILKDDLRGEFESSFVNGFQLATFAGPLCEEPMMGVAFCVEEWAMLGEEVSEGLSITNLPFGPFSGQIMSAVKEGCRKAYQAQPQRLMAAMYSCNVIVDSQVLGRLYAVLGRRHGRVLSGDLASGSASFHVTATLPVAESFRFAEELRTQTSGLASPQLIFSHWEVIDIDPFWTPSTDEEYLHFGEKADSANRAKRYVDAVRRRKGLHVDDKLVEFAEKQRTLSKNK